MLIPVSQFCGPYCIDPADGERLFAEVSAALRRGEPICLDFDGVSVVTGSFLNAAVGCLYGVFGADVLEKQLTSAAWIRLTRPWSNGSKTRQSSSTPPRPRSGRIGRGGASRL